MKRWNAASEGRRRRVKKREIQALSPVRYVGRELRIQQHMKARPGVGDKQAVGLFIVESLGADIRVGHRVAARVAEAAHERDLGCRRLQAEDANRRVDDAVRGQARSLLRYRSGSGAGQPAAAPEELAAFLFAAAAVCRHRRRCCRRRRRGRKAQAGRERRPAPGAIVKPLRQVRPRERGGYQTERVRLLAAARAARCTGPGPLLGQRDGLSARRGGAVDVWVLYGFFGCFCFCFCFCCCCCCCCCCCFR